MITISVLGLDQYVTGHYSKDHTKNLADLYEISEDEISFYAPESYVFHKGVEQTSWNTIVRIHAPHQFEPFQERVARYIMRTLKDFTINISIEFFYFDKKNRYELLNDDYPRFITEENVVHAEDEELSEDEELYEGNVFADLEAKLSDASKTKK